VAIRMHAANPKGTVATSLIGCTFREFIRMIICNDIVNSVLAAYSNPLRCIVSMTADREAFSRL
jgi:hypothetical protein